MCSISDECFSIPSGYRSLHSIGRGRVDQEEELLQMAIRQSLLEQQLPAQEEEEEVCTWEDVM